MMNKVTIPKIRTPLDAEKPLHSGGGIVQSGGYFQKKVGIASLTPTAKKLFKLPSEKL